MCYFVSENLRREVDICRGISLGVYIVLYNNISRILLYITLQALLPYVILKIIKGLVTTNTT